MMKKINKKANITNIDKSQDPEEQELKNSILKQLKLELAKSGDQSVRATLIADILKKCSSDEEALKLLKKWESYF